MSAELMRKYANIINKRLIREWAPFGSNKETGMAVYKHPNFERMLKDTELSGTVFDPETLEIAIDNESPNLEVLVKQLQQRGWVQTQGTRVGGPSDHLYSYYKHRDADRLLKDTELNGTQFDPETLEISVPATTEFSTTHQALVKSGWRSPGNPYYDRL